MRQFNELGPQASEGFECAWQLKPKLQKLGCKMSQAEPILFEPKAKNIRAELLEPKKLLKSWRT